MNPIENLDERQKYERLKGQMQIMEEGDIVEGFLTGRAWQIIERTFDAQISVYEQEAFDSAGNRLKDVRNALGRIQALKEMKRLIKEDFISQRQVAFEQKIQDEIFYKQEGEIEEGVHNELGEQPYPGQRPGLL